MNMRKIIAVLAAVLMLCTMIPIGAMSVTAAVGDVAVSANFDSGVDDFQSDCSISADGGYLTFDATGANWANTYLYANNIKADTNYVVTFKAMANKDAKMNFKINNGWAGDLFVETVDVTTEWQDYEISMSGLALTSTALVMFTSPTTAANGAIYYIDDVVITEVVDPALIGKIVNADFETGDKTGWETYQSTVIDAESAHTGSYGAHMIGGGTWGGMLSQTVYVNAGKSYEISFWVKVNTTGVNVQFMDQTGSGTKLNSGWIDANTSEWTQKTYIVTAASDAIYINFCGGNTGVAEDVYVDDLTCVEVKDPSYDGYITNGDFETGKTDPWDPVWPSWADNMSIVEDGRDGGYAMQVNVDQYQLVRQLVNVEPNTDYVVQVYAKNVTNMALLTKSYPADQNIVQTTLNGGDDWTQTSLVFNSGDNSQVYVAVMGNSAGASAIVDDFFMFEKVEESNDGYIVNGTFETGALTPWYNLWGSCPTAEIVRDGKDSNFAVHVVSGQWKHVRQVNIAVEPNTDYTISTWAKNASNMSLLVKGMSQVETGHGNGVETGDIKNIGISAGDEWTLFSGTFNSGDHEYILVSMMGAAADAYGTFDNITMEKVEPACEHEYEYECSTTCSLCSEEREAACVSDSEPCVDGLCIYCGNDVLPTAEHSYFYPCDIVCQVCYQETNPDAAHNVQHVEAAEATCTENGNVEYWYCSDCGSAWLDEDCSQVTNLRSVIVPAAHTYTDNCDMDCDVCGEYRDAPHNLTTYVEAVVPANCLEEGHDEYWVCEDCGGAFRSNGMGGYYETNPAWLFYTGDHVRPEGAAACAIVVCELCGEDSYGSESCVRPEGDPVCQDSTCVNCGDIVWGWGCNYNTGEEETPLPLCQPGTCVYCGTEYEYLYECENGAWAPCLDGECSYGCGKQYPATANHTLEDCTIDGYCQVCWSYIPAGEHSYDDDADAVCNVCGAEREIETPEIVYGDADGDGEITNLDVILLQQFTSGWDVTLDEVSADADGDGEITNLDVILLQQFTSGWDVTLGG